MRQLAVRWMRRQGWNTSGHDNRLTGRAYHLASDRHRWWDWGHRLMTVYAALLPLVGSLVGSRVTPVAKLETQHPAAVEVR